MLRQLLLLIVLVAGSQSAAFAADAQSANDTYKAEEKKAADQYAADRKLCAGEPTSSLRMQCLRDASAEHDKALAAAKQKLAADSKAAPAAETRTASVAACTDCGRVIDVRTGTKEGKGGALGIIGGGVAGALLGRQVGGGTGRDIATIAGAAGGAYAGNKVEEKMRSANIWTVRVRLDGGEERTFDFEQDPGYVNGDPVRVSGGRLTRR